MAEGGTDCWITPAGNPDYANVVDNRNVHLFSIEKDDNYFSIAKNRILTRHNELKGGK